MVSRLGIVATLSSRQFWNEDNDCRNKMMGTIKTIETISNTWDYSFWEAKLGLNLKNYYGKWEVCLQLQFTFSNFGLKMDKLGKNVSKLLNYVYIYTNSDFSLQKNLNQPGKILVFVIILIVFFVVIVATKIFPLSCCRNKIL